MSYLVAAPEYVSSAATDLASIGSAISAANASAAGPTTGMLAAGADEVSAAVTSVFADYAQSYQALSAQVGAFHAQFVQALNAAGSSYAVAEAANVSPLQTVQQDVLGAINAPVQTLQANTPIAGLNSLLPGSLTNLNLGGVNLGGLANIPSNVFANGAPSATVQQSVQAVINAPAQTLLANTQLGGLGTVLTADVNSLSNSVSIGLGGFNLGSLPTLGGLTSGLTSLGGLISGIPSVGSLTGSLANLNLSSLTSLAPGSLANLTPGGLTNMVDGTLSTIFPNGLYVDGFNLLNLANVPYDLFANVVNIPYYESLALQEYAYALGPAGSIGGVLNWVPSGATVANGGAVQVPGGLLYAVGGTGSWYMESMGNTWGWDNGNWPQVDALLHFFLPFQFTESLANQFQIFSQAELIDGASVNTEFETGNPFAYLGGWLHGETPLSSLLSGTVFPTTLTDTIGQNVGSIINLNPSAPDSPGPNVAIWSGQPAQLQPLVPLQALGANLTEPPSANPIMLPDLNNVLTSSVQLYTDMNNDFDPFITGSFVYWGAATDYSIPAAIGGTIQNFTGIPNQFVGIGQWQPYGAEPVWGYTTTPSSLLTTVPEGGQYLAQGLQGYLNPAIYAQALSTDIASLNNPSVMLSQLPLIGYLGIDP